MMYLFFLILSCTPASTNQSFVFGGEPEQENETLEQIGNWSIGEEEPCTDPQEQVSWQDKSATLWGETRENGDGQPAGCIALLPKDDNWIVAGTTRTINVRWSYLDGSQLTEHLISPSVVRLRVADFDGDSSV